MLQISTLRVKPMFVKPDPTGQTTGTQIIDLTAASLNFSNPLTVTNTAVTPQEMAMRPDLMASAYYGEDSKLDYICKFNGISNPFALNAGDLIMIGDQQAFTSNFVANPTVDAESASITTQDLRNSFFDPNRLSKKDATRLAYLQKKAANTSVPSATQLPPNFSQPGAQEITVANGKVIFGNNVVASKANCPTTLTRAAVKAKLLENQIFKNTQVNATVPSAPTTPTSL